MLLLPLSNPAVTKKQGYLKDASINLGRLCSGLLPVSTSRNSWWMSCAASWPSSNAIMLRMQRCIM